MKLPVDLNEPIRRPASAWKELVLEGIGVITLFVLMFIILLGW